MIRLPEEIAEIIKTIENAGFEAYAVGGCVRDSILGRRPEDWDITSNASRDTLEVLFPNAQTVNKKLGVIRVFRGETMADIAAYRIDGEYKDYRRPETVTFTEDIDEDLKRRDFTMNAIAVSPDRGVADPYGGREDIQRKLIRGIGDPRVRFEEDALRILRAVRFAAQLDFEIDGDTLQAMKEKAKLLEYISMERIRDEFVKTVTAVSGGKGLSLYLETGLISYIFGESAIQTTRGYIQGLERPTKPKEGLEKLTCLAKTIDLTEPDPSIRLALIYQCLEKERAVRAIEFLGYSNEMKKLLRYAVAATDELDGIRGKTELKRFISGIGFEYYKFLTNLSEQRSRVWGPGGDNAGRGGSRQGESAASLQEDSMRAGILCRAALLKEIQDNREPVFPEDLAVNGNDLKGLGIKEGVEIGRLLAYLLDTAHQFPEKNDKCLLLSLAASEHRLNKQEDKAGPDYVGG
jgi:tRNA nucleotidyltransferase (CCA-adding enzyme)